jgi:DNA repair protein SbcC/Rad50
MRPALLTIEGLACFRDKQEIDLRPLELFAICGPTGAGKSSLLDAITFALYGEVPRVSTPERTQMISASRDVVKVVLEFTVGHKRYRIARTLRRSGQHTVRLERNDGLGFNVNLADQVREAKEKVEEIIGLNAIAFTQAVVLPQGEFAQFLKSQPSERRDMLRSLLRLDVYEVMRDKAQRIATAMKSAVEQKRKLLQEEYADVTGAALAALRQRHEAVNGNLGTLRDQRVEAEEVCVNLRAQRTKTVELLECEAKEKSLLSQSREIERLRVKAAAARRAAPLLPFIKEAERAAIAAAAVKANVGNATAQRDRVKAEAVGCIFVLEQAEIAAQAIPDLRERLTLLHQVIGKLAERDELEKSIARLDAEDAKHKKDLAEREMQLATALAAQEQHGGARTVAKDAIATISYDGELHAKLERLRSALVALGISRRAVLCQAAEFQKKKQDLDKLQGSLSLLDKDVEAARRVLEEARTRSAKANDAIEGALHLDAANQLRRNLKPNESCPVCEQMVASPPPASVNSDVESARTALQVEQGNVQTAEIALQRAQDAFVRAEATLKTQQKGSGEFTERLNALQAKLAVDDHDLRSAFAGVAPVDIERIEDWAEEQGTLLATRRQMYETARSDLRSADLALERAKEAETTARTLIGEKRSLLDHLSKEASRAKGRFELLQAEIAAVTESKDAKAEASALGRRVDALELELKGAQGRASDVKTRLAVAEDALQRIAAEAERAALEAEERAQQSDEHVKQAGFESEGSVKDALLDEQSIDTLSSRIEGFDQAVYLVRHRIKELRNVLGEMRVSEEELLKAEARLKSLNDDVERKHAELKLIEEKIERMVERLARSTKLRDELEREGRSLAIYSQLASDLRSDKFQAYVLEEAFIELISGASERLLSLTDGRYSLTFKDDNILVVDHDNAGETRISATLSGGETFLASLSLALELSDQVQRAAGAVNLDSLFIDEGFGTLDPDTLALVSETIQGLRVGGRMVGIITHIPELRDEFAQQIVVTKHQGFSTVEVRGLSEAA